jgi:hypothetical protein
MFARRNELLCRPAGARGLVGARLPTARAVGYEYAVGLANWLNSQL